METSCKNCATQLVENYHFCPNCGQKTPLHRLSMHEVFHEAFHYFTHADKSFLVLLKELIYKNGRVAKEYVEGKRKKYFSPLNFFMIVAALNLIAMTADGVEEKHDVLKENPELMQMDATSKQHMIQMYERQYEATHFIRTHANKTVLVSLPFMAFIFWLFYRKEKYNYTEHLVAGMFMYAFCTLIFVVLTFLNLLTNIDTNLIYFGCLLLQMGYFSVFYYNFIGDGRKLKAFLVSLSVIISTFMASGILVWLYMAGLFGS
ncbi:MAG: DUF3667 domain-containing protein [Flavobacteriaceae bacterium]|nr:DUF3667 domain-containing protein [Bacteroidota bacterium]